MPVYEAEAMVVGCKVCCFECEDIGSDEDDARKKAKAKGWIVVNLPLDRSGKKHRGYRDPTTFAADICPGCQFDLKTVLGTVSAK